MPVPKIDFGSLTEEETKQVVIAAMSELSLSARVATVVELFEDEDDRNELLGWLETEDD